MSSPVDLFSVYLRNLPAEAIGFRVLDEEDPRHILSISRDVDLYVRPSHDDLPGVIEGLRKLAATATEMADALSQFGGDQ